MTDASIMGASFALAGFTLLLAQVATVDVARGYRALKRTINDHYGHDTFVYPDHQAVEQPQFPIAMVRDRGGEW